MKKRWKSASRMIRVWNVRNMQRHFRSFYARLVKERTGCLNLRVHFGTVIDNSCVHAELPTFSVRLFRFFLRFFTTDKQILLCWEKKRSRMRRERAVNSSKKPNQTIMLSYHCHETRENMAQGFVRCCRVYLLIFLMFEDMVSHSTWRRSKRGGGRDEYKFH